MNEKKYTLLTPSARTAYDEMIKSYEDALLENASEIAKRESGIEVEISLRDVIEAQNNISTNANRGKYRRKERVLTSSLLVGFSYTALGLVMYFSINGFPNAEKLFSHEYLWMLIVVVGILFMAMSLFLISDSMLLRNRIREDSNSYIKYNSPDTIVRMWSMIEQKGKELMTLRGINSEDRHFITVYDFLIHELNSREFIDTLNEIITARNSIVHIKDYDIKKEDILRLIDLSQTIVSELEKRILDIKKVC